MPKMFIASRVRPSALLTVVTAFRICRQKVQDRSEDVHNENGHLARFSTFEAQDFEDPVTSEDRISTFHRHWIIA